MENSLRNHALVQQQNQQKKFDREEYYRIHGIIRSSSTATPGSSSHYGSISNNTNSNKSRTSGSSSSGKSKSTRSGSTRSGEASDEAVHGEPVPLSQHRHGHHQQQQYHYHHQQRYAQHHQYHAVDNVMELHQQQQQYDQYGYTLYRNSLGSSQQSSSHFYQQQQQLQHQYGGHAGGSNAESHYSNILGSIGGMSNHSSEEAYRRVGMRLSLNAHGSENDASMPSVGRQAPPRIAFSAASSCFKPFKDVKQHVRREREKDDTYSSGSGSSKSRSRSRNKKNSKRNIVRKMTLDANQLFRLWHSEHSRIQPQTRRRRRKSGSGNSTSHASSRSSKSDRPSSRDEMSPHQRLAQMTLGDGSVLASSFKNKTGSLSAVIESASQNSSSCTRSTAANSRISRGRGDDKSRTSSTIATENSMGTRNSLRSFGTLPPRGKCLTHPSEGVSNDNLCDNVEGNLILYENDNIHVPRKQVCVLTRGKIPKGAPSSDFRVQSLLGQGTFAQVFKCLHVQTGQQVAVKIVKNKPAYTRQAAVEIDVIRALTTTQEKSTNSKDRSKAGNAGEDKNNSDYMIDMVCYFLYKDHLCLVFELLGLNLYEVLKKRQFRGLPLSLTRTLMRQAIWGAKTLAQRSIVHCDLKPENILLVSEDDSESVMSAGESKRLQSLSNNKKQSAISGASTESINSSSSKTDANQQEDKQQIGQPQVADGTSRGGSSKGGNSRGDSSKSTTETDNTTTQREKEKQDVMHHSKSPTDSTIRTSESDGTPDCNQHIKLIDFGSACFEGQMSHTYIQSRFYRSPEVLLGLAYDSAIDMWSLGCVAAELFLGLPILPGVHEHDQLLRILEMVGNTPDWMLDQGTKSSKYFVKYFPNSTPTPSTPVLSSSTTPEGPSSSNEASTTRSGSEGPRPLPQWRIKTQHEYIASLSHSDIEKKGGLAKLQKQPGNRYFKRKILSEIILHKGQSGKQEDMRSLQAFIHFLYGILDPDPWKRWTAFQVASHPFFTGAELQQNFDPSQIKDDNHANRLFGLYWEAPSDPSIYRRKLLNVQKTREKQQAARRGLNRGSRSRSVSPSSQDGMPTVRNAFSKNSDNGDDAHASTLRTDEMINQPSSRHLHQGSYQGTYNISSSMTQFGVNQGFQLLGSSSGAQPGFSGPQSFSESGNSLGLPGSFNEVDFALALHRPGVVPMGDSVTTATTTSTTSMSSSNNSRSTYTTYNQTSQPGSYGTAQVLHYSSQQRRIATGSFQRTSRSLNEGELAPTDPGTIPTLINSHLHHVAYSSSQETSLEVGIEIAPPIELKPQVDMSVDPSTKGKDGNTSPASAEETKPADYAATDNQATTHENVKPTKTENNTEATTNPNLKANPMQANPNLGVYQSSQVYQQQIAAMQQQFQQQQLLLQQQQAALALQQEQLRVYYSNISNATGIMNMQQFGIAAAPATAANVSNVGVLGSQQFGIAGAQSGPADSAKSNHFGIASTQANAPTMLNAHQFGIAGTQATPSAAINTQQFGIAGAPVTAISAQQFGVGGNTQVQAAASLNPQFGIAQGAAAPVQGGGYYVITNPDGTQMIVPPNAIPAMTGQVPGLAQMPNILSGQLQGITMGAAHIQGLTPGTLSSVGVPGMPGIQAMQSGGIIPPTGNAQGIPNNASSPKNKNQHQNRHPYP